MINSINIIGSGNVAFHMAKTLSNSGLKVTLYCRSLEPIRSELKNTEVRVVKGYDQISKADLSIICVTDDAISQLCSNLNADDKVVHTSGSVGVEVLGRFECGGILYPLQTISKSRRIDLKVVPFLIESQNLDFQNELFEFCLRYLSESCRLTSSKDRERIHLAAVLVNNFTNHLFAEAESILSEVNMPLELLEPLIKETVKKAMDLGPTNSQTGPAKRGDEQIVKKHSKMFNDEKMKQVYLLMSELIKKS